MMGSTTRAVDFCYDCCYGYAGFPAIASMFAATLVSYLDSAAMCFVQGCLPLCTSKFQFSNPARFRVPKPNKP